MLDKLLPITGIGSLNIDSPTEAVNFSSKFDIPFLPQLPSIDGDMLQDKYSSLEEFKSLSNPLLKIQLAGPSTSRKSHKEIFEQVKNLKNHFSNELLICLDEPIIPTIDKDYIKLIELLKPFGKVGVHCCNNFESSYFDKSNLDFLSYDASLVKEVSFQKWIIFGIIPTNKEYDIQRIFEENKSFVKENKSRIILSPACGLASMSLNIEKIYEDLISLRLKFLSQI